jgi:predicted CoA-binding protein
VQNWIFQKYIFQPDFIYAIMGFREKYGNSVAVIGASADRSRYSNKAVRAFLAENYAVFPVNPNEKLIEGLKAHPKILDIQERIDFVSIYLNPNTSISENIPEQLRQKDLKMAILNPGAESLELIQKLNSLNIETLMICSIRSLGKDPEEF